MRIMAEALATASSSLQRISLNMYTHEDFQTEDRALSLLLKMPHLAGAWKIDREEGVVEPTVKEVGHFGPRSLIASLV